MGALIDAGDPAAADARDLLRAAHRAFVPHRVLLAARPGEDLSAIPHVGELLAGRGAAAGRATATVCHRFTCSLPVTGAADLAALLAPPARP